MKENKYQGKIIKRLTNEFPGCVVIKTPSGYIQGLPDLLVLYCDDWFALEVKKSEKETIEPNQEYYVNLFNGMSYASFIYPENEDRVFDELQHAFGVGR